MEKEEKYISGKWLPEVSLDGMELPCVWCKAKDNSLRVIAILFNPLYDIEAHISLTQVNPT
jgi:hypothetical protein